MSTSPAPEADGILSAEAASHAPCRGCTDDCRLRNVCNGAPWRLTREQQDEFLERS